MKKKIFSDLINQIFIFFILSSLTLSLIIWILQAVNFLDIVSEDGHSLSTYFFYSILNLPKIFSKLLMLSFFITIFYILSTYEEKNQTLIFWINGVKKTDFLNKILVLSSLFLIFSFILSFYVVPYSQNKARSYIRDSNLDFLPALIKPKKFIDTVENLTIFLDEKKENSIQKILIKDNSDGNQLIIAKTGFIKTSSADKYLTLNDGIIVDYGKSEKLKFFRYEKTIFNLNKYKTKTTVTPKIQEISSKDIIQCIFLLNKNHNIQIFVGNLNCQNSFYANLLQEIYKRTFLPLYIPLLALMGSFLILKSNISVNYKFYKIKIFLTGIFFVILSQVSINFISTNFIASIFTILLPVIMMIISYITFVIQMKKSS